jgi:hypothetical protein
MLKHERGRKPKPRHHAIARTLQALASPRQARITRTAGMNSIWSAQFGACPVFGIHVSDFDPK